MRQQLRQRGLTAVEQCVDLWEGQGFLPQDLAAEQQIGGMGGERLGKPGRCCADPGGVVAGDGAAGPLCQEPSVETDSRHEWRHTGFAGARGC
ncbi:hypothetical protein BV401_00010 [Streptomyces malaysiensis subsp. malaysiensis]|uniref:Uncharacterized protein n=1 Tax=Streptomyces autolyticus TaxID=75293 RepID=A0ABM6H5E7_9ACTN|nr:hypothetical protein BV401_00010 [Streptomyces autolyticus]